MLQNIAISIYILLFMSIVNVVDSHANIFSTDINQIVTDALQSSNPKKVDKCLNKVIKNNYLTGVLKIRRHAKSMLMLERTKIIRSNKITQKQIQKMLVPWVQIDKKTVEYFKKKKVNQKGKENPLFMYHR